METEDRFGDAIEWFLDHLRSERGASPHTLSAYENDLKRAARFFRAQGLTDWPDIAPEGVLRFSTSLRPALSASSAQRHMSSLRSLLKFLKRRGVELATELAETGGFKPPKRLPKALTLEQLHALLRSPDLTKAPGMRDRALMELIYGAGLRVSEAVGLRIESLHLDSAAVTITGKRGKTRWVPLPAETIAWIDRYLESARSRLAKKPSAHLLLSNRGLPLLRQTAYAILRGHAIRAGLQHVSPHTLRHTYAVHLLKGGADLRAVQELLGHESIATTQVYTQLDLDEVLRKFRAAHPRP